MTTHAQHTPGPWTTGTPGRGRFCVYSQAPEAHGRGVCVMRNTQTEPDDHEWNLIADANARLIAAAPELLALLEEMMIHGCIDQPAIAHRARAAIAKATGASS